MEDLKNRISKFLPNLQGGGAEKVMVTLVNEFYYRGYQLDLVLYNAQGPYLHFAKKGVRIVDLKSISVFKSLFKLTKYYKENTPTVALAALPHANITAILARILSRKKFRLIISERNNNFSRKKIFFITFKTFVLRILVILLYPFSDKIIAVSKELAFKIVNNLFFFKNKKTLIYNPLT